MGAAYQVSCISAIYIAIHNSSKITVAMKIILWLGHHNMRKYVKGSHFENHPLLSLVTLEPEIKASQDRVQHQGKSVSVMARQCVEPESVPGNYQVVLSDSKGFVGPPCRLKKEITRPTPQHLSYKCLLLSCLNYFFLFNPKAYVSTLKMDLDHSVTGSTHSYPCAY